MFLMDAEICGRTLRWITAVLTAMVASRGFSMMCWCLRLREVSVPAVVMRGDSVWLNCSFDLERDLLYSIKWHKDNVEFYRYIPAQKPPTQTYPLPGIYLDMGRSIPGNLYLHRTEVSSEGWYRCEVSTEAPSFFNVKGEKEMRIYVNPTSRPKVLGNKPRYTPGEIVNVTCVSAASRPAAFLKFWINGQEAGAEELRRLPPVESELGLFESRLLLIFPVHTYHFSLGERLRLQCEAILSQAHTLNSEEIIVLASGGATMATSTYDHEEHGPWISGRRQNYISGEVVDINCTVAKSQPPAELHWYINDKEVHPDYLVRRPSVRHPDGRETTVLGLRFLVRSRHFQKREMRLRCTSIQSMVKRMTSKPLEAIMAPWIQQKSDLHVDNTAAVSSRSSWYQFSITFLWTFCHLRCPP